MASISFSPTIYPNPPVELRNRTSLTQYDYLNLLVTQMKFQNPLNPMDYHQMATMLTQFSSLGALNDINKNLENSITYQSSTHSLQAAELIGKKIKTAGNRISIEKNNFSDAYYQLNQPGKVTIRILDQRGNLVRIIDEGFKSASEHKLVWDGKDNMGKPLPDGVYLFVVSAVDSNDKMIPVNHFQVDTIKEVMFEDGIIYLNTNAGRFTMKDIISIIG